MNFIFENYGWFLALACVAVFGFIMGIGLMSLVREFEEGVLDDIDEKSDGLMPDWMIGRLILLEARARKNYWWGFGTGLVVLSLLVAGGYYIIVNYI